MYMYMYMYMYIYNGDKQVTLIEEVVEGVKVVRAVEREEAGEEREGGGDAGLHYARTLQREGGKKKEGAGDKGVRVGSMPPSGRRRAPPGGTADDELEQGKCSPPRMVCKYPPPLFHRVVRHR